VRRISSDNRWNCCRNCFGDHLCLICVGWRCVFAAGVRGVVSRHGNAADVSDSDVEKHQTGSLFPATRSARRTEPVYGRLLQSWRRGTRAWGTTDLSAVTKFEEIFQEFSRECCIFLNWEVGSSGSMNRPTNSGWPRISNYTAQSAWFVPGMGSFAGSIHTNLQRSIQSENTHVQQKLVRRPIYTA